MSIRLLMTFFCHKSLSEWHNFMIFFIMILNTVQLHNCLKTSISATVLLTCLIKCQVSILLLTYVSPPCQTWEVLSLSIQPQFTAESVFHLWNLMTHRNVLFKRCISFHFSCMEACSPTCACYIVAEKARGRPWIS